MSARRRKKAADNNIRRILCVFVTESQVWPCGHDTAYGCAAQDRHERRVLGPLRIFPTDRTLIEAITSQNQPFPLWMSNGAQYHQRYRNRRKRR